MAPRSTLEASVLNPSLERLTQSRRSEFVAEIAAADALRKWSSSESVDELLAVLHARLHNERSVFTTTADLHLIDAAYARATQRISSGLQKAAPLVVDGIDEEQCKHRVDTLRRTLRLAGRVDLCDIFLPTHATAAGKVAGAAAETVLKAATSSRAMSSSVSTQDNAARDALKGCVSEHDRRALRAGLRAARDAEPYLKAAHPAKHMALDLTTPLDTVPDRVLGVFVSCQNGRVGPRHAAFLPAALAMDKLRDPLF